MTEGFNKAWQASLCCEECGHAILDHEDKGCRAIVPIRYVIGDKEVVEWDELCGCVHEIGE